MIEKIICSAIWFKDGVKRTHQPVNVDSGIVVCGHRHGHCFVILHELFPDRRYIIMNKDGKTTIQGFLTNLNRFVDRKDAAFIAINANQIIRPFGIFDKNYLYSEDIY